MKKTLFISVIALLLVVGTVNAISMTINNLSDAEITLTVDELRELLVEEQEMGRAFYRYTGDVIGSRVGTTTTGVGFYSYATSTYINKIGGFTDTAIYNFSALEASTTVGGGASVSMWFSGSNDDECATTTAATGGDYVITGDINWYDIGVHLKDFAGSQQLTQASSTINWSPNGNRQNRTVVFKDLGYECLKAEVGATSTVLFAELKLK